MQSQGLAASLARGSHQADKGDISAGHDDPGGLREYQLHVVDLTLGYTPPTGNLQRNRDARFHDTNPPAEKKVKVTKDVRAWIVRNS